MHLSDTRVGGVACERHARERYHVPGILPCARHGSILAICAWAGATVCRAWVYLSDVRVVGMADV